MILGVELFFFFSSKLGWVGIEISNKRWAFWYFLSIHRVHWFQLSDAFKVMENLAKLVHSLYVIAVLIYKKSFHLDNVEENDTIFSSIFINFISILISAFKLHFTDEEAMKHVLKNVFWKPFMNQKLVIRTCHVLTSSYGRQVTNLVFLLLNKNKL